MSQPNNNDHKYTKIFVGGLAWRTTTYGLRSFFQQFGEVLDANVVTENFPGGNSKSKGYGFVTFRDAESASTACEPPYPIIDGRQTNINLAYIRAKHNTNHSNQNGLLRQTGPWHQNQNDSFNQVASHQHQLVSTNPYFPQVYWDPNYGVYPYMYTVPHYPYSTTTSCQYVPTSEYAYGMQQNWHPTNNQRPAPISKLSKELKIKDITDNNQEEVSTSYVVNEDADTETDSDVDQQKREDQEKEINGQDNGINKDVKDREIEIMSEQNDEAKQNADVIEVTVQSETVLEEEAENTLQVKLIDQEEEGKEQEYMSKE